MKRFLRTIRFILQDMTWLECKLKSYFARMFGAE
jgi:hypothetical protein